MNQDSKGLKVIVQEVEAVFAKHGVSGAVAVASEHFSYYGMYYPEGAPLRLEGHDDIRIDRRSLETPTHRAFLASLSGLAEASKTISQSAVAMWDLVLKILIELKHQGRIRSE